MLLCRQCVRHLSYPLDYDATDKEEVDKFDAWRRQVGDTVGDCCLFLGVNAVLSLLWEEAAQEGPVVASTGNWLKLEGSLKAMLAAVRERECCNISTPHFLPF